MPWNWKDLQGSSSPVGLLFVSGLPVTQDRDLTLKLDILDQHCPIELSVMIAVLSVCTIWKPLNMHGYEHLKCD